MLKFKSVAVVIVVLAIISMASAFGADKKSCAGTVKRDSGKVWVDGVKKLEWGKDENITFISALAAALNAIGENVTSDYLMGVSGVAFRVQFFIPDGCPSSPDAVCGFDCSIPAAKALGYPLIFIESSADIPEEVKKVRDVVVKSIDKGRPVVALDLIELPDWGVIAGYSDKGEKFLCRTYYDKSSELSIAQKWPWVVAIIGDKEKAPSRKQSVIESLKIAQKVAETDKFGNYASGYSAFDIWIKQLQDKSGFDKLDVNDQIHRIHMNAWCYECLTDCRSAAVRYLKSVKGELSPKASDHIVKAADIYEQEVKLLTDGRKNAPFPWGLKEGESWTQEMRNSEAETLKKAMELEKKAIAEIKAALELQTK